ncbi:ABC transporter substrate-binding protein [Mesorhizobium sp. M0119]|uniref:ABC transporter substrate-binding protein n=1 Tax=Mesorhizobium sp. M0119 TaxID=2956885 RepID=UPI003338F4D9
MGISINRRDFIKVSSSVAAAVALPSISGPARAQSPGELRVLVYGGAAGEAVIKAYVKPFEHETGVKVTPVTDQIALAQIELMVKNNSVSVDVGGLTQGEAYAAASKGYLQDIDYSIYKKDDLNGIASFAKEPFGVGTAIYAYVMTYNTKTFPAGKPRPTNWAEFWDTNKFPGVRSLVSGQYGSEGPWEEALLADGVPPDAIYPMDLDRVFASLDKIKPHIRKWWGTGSEIQQIMRDGAADLVNTYDGRATLLIDQGAPLEINRNQSKLTWDFWVIPKGSPNVGNAQKFIEFVSRADRQAVWARLMPYGPTNVNAFKALPDEMGRKLASHPDNLKNSITINMKWYGEVGSDGLSNTERLVQRWNEWILL